MRQLLRRLGYRSVPNSGRGSHTWLEAPGRPRVRWAFHGKDDLAPGLVREILVRQVKLSLDEAREVVGGD